MKVLPCAQRNTTMRNEINIFEKKEEKYYINIIFQQY